MHANKINQKSNIYLIGPMGAGKTTVGRILSIICGKLFYDLDKEIERHVGISISDIFKKNGEMVFRHYESEQLECLSRFNNIIISTGGGAVLSPHNRHRLSTTGIVLYLQVSIDEQIKRTSSQSGHRPLLQQYNTQEKLMMLAQERKPLYQSIADFYYDTDRKTPDVIIRAILADIHDLLITSSSTSSDSS